MRKTFLLLFVAAAIAAFYLLGSGHLFSDRQSTSQQHESFSSKNLQNGDLIFQISQSAQSKAIQLATNSKYSHIGILFEENGDFFVFEAVQPVKLTPLKNWIEKGEKGHYIVKRLENAKSTLTPDVIDKMKSLGKNHLGKNYDIYFEWSDERMYCSELVWKIYKEATDIEIGELQSLSSFDLTSDTVKQKIKERYGSKPPLEEPVISPAAMFHCDYLVEVFAN